MGMLKEFKEFAMKGNAMDLAIGVVIGAAFKSIVDSLVKDIIMPIVGMFGSVDFNNYILPLGKAKDGSAIDTVKQAADANVPVLAYGNLLTVLINFLIVAFAVLLLVRSVNKWMPKPAPRVTTRDCPQCAMPIPVAAKKCGHCTSAV